MKALVYAGTRTLQIEQRDKPAPAEGEVLVKIRACGICGSDVHGYLGITGRRIAPMVMGHEFAGEVKALGHNTSGRYKRGDRVTVQPVLFCGECDNCQQGLTNACTNRKFFGVMDVDGAFQEYLAVPEKLLYPLPDQMSFEEGALIEPLAVAYCGVKKAGSLAGKKCGHCRWRRHWSVGVDGRQNPALQDHHPVRPVRCMTANRQENGR